MQRNERRGAGTSRQLFFASNLRVSFGPRTVLAIQRLELQTGDRIGLVGANGAGKTTLLQVMAGARAADEGELLRHCPIGYVRQTDMTEQAAGAVDPALAGRLGVVDSPVPSGGEATRRALAEALSSDAPVLLLDEPTTSLDIDGIAELQKQLQRHEGALVLVSHDRVLLDALCTKIWEIEGGAIRVFPGNYSAFYRQKERERAFQQEEYDAYRAEQARLSASIREVEARARGMAKPRRNMASSEWLLYKDIMSTQQKHVHQMAKSLRSRLSQLEVKQRPQNLPLVAMMLGAGRPIVSRTALRVGPLDVRFGERTLLRGVSFHLPTGTRTAMIGPNGSGKTTLLRQIVEGGEGVRLQQDARIGYFSQQHDVLRPADTALAAARSLSAHDETVARTVLARLGLRGDDAFKPISVLSGGERAKVALARLLLADINLLVLDEPTNHLDLYAMESLQELLAQYGGTLLVVTHDRALCTAVAQRIIRVADGRALTYEGGFAAWEASLAPQRPADEAARQLDEDTIRMRMAALTDRIAKKAKGDDPANLEAEWQSLLAQLKAARG